MPLLEDLVSQHGASIAMISDDDFGFGVDALLQYGGRLYSEAAGAAM